MADYQLEYSDGTYSQIFNSLSLFSYVRNSSGGSRLKVFHASGEDIEINRLFRLTVAKIIIKDLKTQNVNFQFLPDNNMHSRDVEFSNCEIENISIINLTLNRLHLISSKVGVLYFEDIEFEKSLEITENSVVGDLKIVSKKVIPEIKFLSSQIQFASAFLEIGIILLSNNKDSTFIFQSCKLHEFRSEGSNSGIIRLFDTQLLKIEFLNSTKIETCIEDCYLENFVTINLSEESKFFFSKLKLSPIFKFVISNAEKTNVAISDSYFNNEIRFDGSTSSESCKLVLQNLIFKDIVIFNKEISQILIIENSLFQKGIFVPIHPKYLGYKEISYVHSSVWCTLKNQALSRNDNINALELKKREMEAYTRELKNGEGKCLEKIVLFLNKWSNDHGLNWGKGLAFTFVCWLVFFSFYYTCSHEGFGFNNVQIDIIKKSFWIDAFKFLWIPQGIDLLTNSIMHASFWWIPIFSSISFLFGKIFIGYGIYQTISAFRKHGK